jgi:hypothetical protein
LPLCFFLRHPRTVSRTGNRDESQKYSGH